MNLLDMPPEIFYKIMEEYVTSTSYHSDLKNLRLVNKNFNYEVTRAVCATKSLFNLTNPAPYYPEYLRYMYYTSNKKDDYLARTIKHVTNQLLQRDPSEQKEEASERVSLAVAHAALDFMVSGLTAAMKEKSTEILLPNRRNMGYVHRADEYEFDLSMRLGEGQKPDAFEHVLSVAAYVGNMSLVKHLIEEYGIDCNFRSNVFGPPLRNAALKGHVEVVRLLLEKGADAEGGRSPRTHEDHRMEAMEQITRLFRIHRLPCSHTRPDTALQAAARSAHKEIVEILLQPEHGVSRSAQSYRDAIIFSAFGGDPEILEMLFGGVAVTLLTWLSEQIYWDHMLQLAACNGNTEMLQLLLNKGAHINSRGSILNRATPLAVAASNGHNEAVIFLLSRGADINLGEYYPLYMAAAFGFPHTSRLLLDRGARINPAGDRSIESAVKRGHADVVRVFSERGLHKLPSRSLSGRGRRGSLLWLAKSLGHQRVARVLEEFSARE